MINPSNVRSHSTGTDRRENVRPSSHNVAQTMLSRGNRLHASPKFVLAVNEPVVIRSNFVPPRTHTTVNSTNYRPQNFANEVSESVVSPDIDVVGYTPEYTEQGVDGACYMSPEIGMMNSLLSARSSEHPSHSSLSTQRQMRPPFTAGMRQSQDECYDLRDDEYEQSQALSQYHHAPVQRVARELYTSDNEGVLESISSSVSGSGYGGVLPMLNMPYAYHSRRY